MSLAAFLLSDSNLIVNPPKDIWHNWHGGLGKNFISSAIAEVLPHMASSVGIDKKMDVFNAHYETWRKTSSGKRLHSAKLSTELFGLTSLQVMPNGMWSKFADTTVLLSWLEAVLQTDLVLPVAVVQDILQATKAMNEALRKLYNGGVWLSREEANASGAAGLLFLRMYAGLAADALKAGRARFSITPKAHYLHHAFLDMYTTTFAWSLSPLSFSVQIDEDFIGRVSRYSRRVGSQKQMERTIGRYKVAALLAIQDAESGEK